MFAGQIGCEVLNWTLKRMIREERPTRKDPALKTYNNNKLIDLQKCLERDMACRLHIASSLRILQYI